MNWALKEYIVLAVQSYAFRNTFHFIQWDFVPAVCYSIAVLGPNPIQPSNAEEAMPIVHALHPAGWGWGTVTEASLPLFPYLGAAVVLESGIRLGPESVSHFT